MRYDNIVSSRLAKKDVFVTFHVILLMLIDQWNSLPPFLQPITSSSVYPTLLAVILSVELRFYTFFLSTFPSLD